MLYLIPYLSNCLGMLFIILFISASFYVISKTLCSFNIDSVTGVVKIQKALQAGKEYKMTVRANDKGTPLTKMFFCLYFYFLFFLKLKP